MTSIYKILRPLIMLLPAEAAHDLSLKVFKTLYPLPKSLVPDPILETTVSGLAFKTPIGLAAGYDKNAEIPRALLNAGFGFVEVGTLTPRPQAGNPKPRLFRLRKDQAVINRLGFNNCGQSEARERLEHFRAGEHRGIVGVNIGANKDSEDRARDYLRGLRTFFTLADYFTVNVSSPNTPGLRDLQEKKALNELLSRLANERASMVEETSRDTPPIFLKIAPDLDDGALEGIVEAAIQHGLDGLIVSNTTIDRPETLNSKAKAETGGLSGQPLFERSTAVLEHAYRLSRGKLALIGAGGVATPEQAYEKILKGASLVQIYSGLVYEGPGLPLRLDRGLAELLRRDGYTSVSQAVGKGVK